MSSSSHVPLIACFSHMQNTEQLAQNNKIEIPLRGVSHSWHQKPWGGGFEWFINVRRSQRSNYNLICTVGHVLLFITHTSFLTFLWMLYHSSNGSPILLISLEKPPSFKMRWTATARQAGDEQAHPFVFSILLKSLIQVSQPGIPELSTLKTEKKKTSYFGINVSKMELGPTEESESKNSRLKHQIFVLQWQMLCKVSGTQRGFPALVELMVLLGR